MQIEIPWNELHKTEGGTVLYFNTLEPHAENLLSEGFAGSDTAVIELTNGPIRSSKRPAAVAIVIEAGADVRAFEIDSERGYRVFHIQLGFLRTNGSIRPVHPLDGPRLLAPYEMNY